MIYQNPPLVEALFAISFNPLIWEDSFAEAFWEEMKGKYPEKSIQDQVAIRFEFKEGQPHANPAEGRTQILECKSADNASLVRLSRNMLSVHALRPYQSWQIFKPQILEAAHLLRDITGGITLRSSSLRYINHINIGDSHSFENLARFFEIKPVVPATFLGKLGAVQNFLEFLQDDGENVLSLTQTTLQPIEDQLAPVQLDLLYTSLAASRIAPEELSTWLETAHDLIEDTFHKSITTFAQQQFGEI